ncbi:hypothetical protein GWD52_13270 [Enterobacteriaceae bacterium 4M9]|nr:hypothetical protein [Enterobacteriaceae bacterium 4M9]
MEKNNQGSLVGRELSAQEVNRVSGAGVGGAVAGGILGAAGGAVAGAVTGGAKGAMAGWIAGAGLGARIGMWSPF